VIAYHLPEDLCKEMDIKTEVGAWKYFFYGYWLFARFFTFLLLGAPFAKNAIVAINRFVYANLFHYLLNNKEFSFVVPK
jgi:hypothetical protein